MSLYKIYKIQILKKQFMRAIYSDLPPSAHSKLMDPRASILHPTLPWLYAAHLMSGSFAAPGKARHLEHILESGTCGAHHGSSCTGGGYWGVVDATGFQFLCAADVPFLLSLSGI